MIDYSSSMHIYMPRATVLDRTAMHLLLGLLGLAALSATAPSCEAFTDTEHWLGAEYTPAAAPGNGYWWQWYDDYEASVERELPMLKKHMGFTTMRVWLMYGVYAADPDGLHAKMSRFLAVWVAQERLSAKFHAFSYGEIHVLHGAFICLGARGT